MDDCELDTASDDFTHSDNEYGWEGLSWDERVKDLTGHLRNRETWESMESAVSEFRDHDNREVPTLLHHLSKDKLAHGFYDLPETTRICILDCLLQVHLLDDDAISEHAQANEIGEDETPFSILISALKHVNLSFLDAILTNLKDPLLQLLQIPHGSKRRNPLHEGFRVLFLKQRGMNKTSSISNKEGMKADLRVLTRIVHDWVELAPKSALAARDNDGNTPLHYAMNYNLCYYLDAKVYRPLVVALIDKSLSSRMQVECLFNKEGKSSYLIYLDSESWFAEKQHTLSSSKPAAVNGVSGSKSNPLRLGIEGKRVEGKEKPGEEARRETQNEPSQPLCMPSHSDPLTISWTGLAPPDRFQTTSLSLPPRWVRNPKVLLFTQDNRKPAASESMLRSPSMRSRAGAPKEPKPYQIQQSRVENSRRKEAADEIRQYLRLCYLRNMSDVDAKNLLYGNVASDKNLYFDATHLRGRGPAQIVQLIQKLARAGGFEDTLSYVKIPQLSEPYWLPEPASKANTTKDKRGPNGVGSQQKATVGRNALVSVFDELAATGVQRILRLQVEDHGHELAHPDTAIERAIRGWNYRGESDPFGTRTRALKIETWDWRKPDISIELIRDAAPEINTLHLHWSGGQTVLRGWADTILDLHPQFKELTSIHLHAYQGLESKERTDIMINTFIKKVEKSTEGRVQVKQISHQERIIDTRADEETHYSPAQGDSTNEKQYHWVTRMEEFRDAMLKVHEDVSKDIVDLPRVRVGFLVRS